MYRRELRRRRRLGVVAILLAGVALVLALRSGPVALVPPAASAADTGRCLAVIARLPHTLDHSAMRTVTPPSPLTRAWGRPAITLRCGLPPVAHPVSANVISLGGVAGTSEGALAWYQDVFDSTLWVTRTAPRLAVRIPGSEGSVDVLGPITSAALGR